MGLMVRGLWRSLGGQKVVQDVSMGLERGDAYGLLGHNGAGKTTTMRMILGLIRPSQGTVVIDGVDIRNDPRRARALVGGLIETPGFHPSWSAAANLRALGRLQGLSGPTLRREVERSLHEVGLSAAGRKPVRAFSQGMRQRLGLAQAMLGRPPYLILDEPTNGLDPEGIADIRSVLMNLRDDHHTTLLISSHQLHEISGLCNRVGIVKSGRMVVEQDVSSLLASNQTRYSIHGTPAAAVSAALDSLGIASELPPAQDANERERPTTVRLAPHSPGHVARTLIQAGVDLTEFAPIRPSLESVYLEVQHPEERAVPVGAPKFEALPAEAGRRSVPVPSRPVLRVLRYDLGRWARSYGTWVVLAIPAGLAVLSVRGLAETQAAAMAEVEAGTLASATQVTGFEALGIALQTGLPLLALVLAGLASQSVASEFSQGTLRNVFLRPARRWQIALGKALSILVLVLVGYGVLLGASVLAAHHAFAFGDRLEIMPSGEPFPVVSAGTLWEEVPALIRSPLLPLVALGWVGFLAGTMIRHAASALALALVLVAGSDWLKVFFRHGDAEAWLPSAYLPSFLGDRTSFVQHFIHLTQNVGNTSFPLEATALSHPSLIAASVLLLAVLLIVRRPVP